LLNLWLLFLICALIIIFTGTKLTRYGDIIAEKTGLGRVWIGAALIPLATSLPELTSSSGAAWINAPNLAIGNIFGSIMFNLLIIAIADFAHGPGPLLREVIFRPNSNCYFRNISMCNCCLEYVDKTTISPCRGRHRFSNF